MSRWVLVGSVMKGVAEALVACLMVLALAASVFQAGERLRSWPERVSHFLDELSRQGYDFELRRMSGKGR